MNQWIKHSYLSCLIRSTFYIYSKNVLTKPEISNHPNVDFYLEKLEKGIEQTTIRQQLCCKYLFCFCACLLVSSAILCLIFGCCRSQGPPV